MVVEYIRYNLTTHQPSELEAAYAKAAVHLDAAPECLSYELAQCGDDPKSFILRIVWASRDAHMQDFRAGPHFPPFLALVRPFIPELAEMRHYNVGAVNG